MVTGYQTSPLCGGTNITVTVSATNNPTSYQWVYYDVNGNQAECIDGILFEGSSTATLTILDGGGWAGLETGGNFTLICVVDNISGSVQYPIHLNIGSMPSAAPTVVTTSPAVCAGSNNVLYTVKQNAAMSGFTWSYSGSGATITNPTDTAAEINFSPTATSGSISVYGQNGCGSGPVATIPVTVNSQQVAIPAGTAGGAAVCDNHDVSTSTAYADPANCSAIASIVPAGGSPVSGTIQSCVTVDASIQNYQGRPYVPRHFNLEPAANAATATGTVTLYFTQSDFDKYNAVRGSLPSLPTGPADATDAGNLQITLLNGAGTTPATYSGVAAVITPGGNNVVWNAASGRWEISFLSTGFGGYFLSSVSLKPQLPIYSMQPTTGLTCKGTSYNGYFFISTTNTDSFVWQLSSDQGNTWNTISDNADFRGSNTSYLEFSGDDTLNNHLVRGILSNIAGMDTTTSGLILIDTGQSTAANFSSPNMVVCKGQTQLYTITGANLLDSMFFYSSIPYTNSGPFDTTVLLNFNVTPGTYTLFANISNSCGIVSRSISIVVQPSGTDSANVANQQECSTTPVYPNGTTMYTNGNCNAIGAILPSGSNPVSGNIQTCVTMSPTVPSYGGIAYVPRYYSLEPSANASTSTATVTLYFTQADFTAYNAARGSEPALPTGPTDAVGISNLRVSQFHGTGTTPDTYVGGSGTIDPADSNIVWDAINSRWSVTFNITGFSGFFVSGTSIVPLPLTLTNFSGQAVAAGNLLSWQTTSEENTAYFEVQRATPGSSTFADLGQVAAAGNSSVTRQYSYTDALATAHPTYSYRLKMVDLDGQYTYSPVVTLQSLVPSLTVLVSPNPFTQPVSLTVGSPAAGTANVVVLDISGARLVERSVVLQKGDNALDVSMIAGLPQGVYFLQVSTGSQQQTVKFVKE